MAAYGTRYLGGPNKVYLVCMRIEKPIWMTVSEVKDKIQYMLNKTKREDDTYYFDDDDSLQDILEWIEIDDPYVYYRFICDKETCKTIEKTRKYYGVELEKTGGRLI